MPRRKPEPPVIPTTSLVAAATRYTGRVPRIYVPQQDWQAECYRHYGICGEARFAAKFYGHALSRAVLGVATVENGKKTGVESGPAVDALNLLFNGPMAQEEMLDKIGTHLTVAGECYLVGREVDGTDVWEVVSCLEMKVTGNRWTIEYGNGIEAVVLGADDVVIRIWLPHPAKRIEADSPFRALLPILSEIEWLTRHVYAQITSRLAGSGILIMPQGMSFPPAPAEDGKEIASANEADAFMMTLADAMITPIQDPGSPSATVPIVVTAPDETIDKPRLLKFWSDLDAAAKDLRGEAIRRFALGMDLPPEQVLGMSSNSGTGGGTSNGISHWGAWQVEEATIRLHIEPMLDVIANSITVGYLRPLLADGDTSIVTHNTAALRLRPDRSKEAVELYDRGLISVTTLLRENGFDPEQDRPDEKEFQRWLLIKIASGSSTPEQLHAALRELGINLDVPSLAPGRTQELPSPPSLEEHPRRPRDPSDVGRRRRRRSYTNIDGDQVSVDEPDALLAACDALVFRALERAGNRLRQSGGRPPGVPSYETHVFVRANGSTTRLLEDAWSCAPQVLDGIVEDHESVVRVLDSYCQTLMTEQSPHTRQRLEDWLNLAEVES